MKTDLNIVPDAESQGPPQVVKNNLSGEQMLSFIGSKVKKRVLTRQNAIEVSKDQVILS